MPEYAQSARAVVTAHTLKAHDFKKTGPSLAGGTKPVEAGIADTDRGCRYVIYMAKQPLSRIVSANNPAC